MRKNITVEFTNERIIPSGGLAVVGAILGICYAIPSAETLRQRLDLVGGSVHRQVLDENIHMLKSNGIVPSKLPCGYVPVDMDVSPFDNSKTSKEGVSRTYKGCDGYAPHVCLYRQGRLPCGSGAAGGETAQPERHSGIFKRNHRHLPAADGRAASFPA